MRFRTVNLFDNSTAIIGCVSSIIYAVKKYFAYCFLRHSLKGVFIKQFSYNNSTKHGM